MILFRLTLALAAGGIYVFGYAPFNLWFLTPSAILLLLGCLHNQKAAKGFLIGWSFGIGLFGSGVSWIYHSLHVYGEMSVELATALTILFCLFMALFYGICCSLYCLFNYSRRSIFSSFNVPILIRILSFASLWTLFELIRAHTAYISFPWLLLGNSLIDTPLAYWAPLGGTFLIGFLCLLSIAALFHLLLFLPSIYVRRNQYKVLVLILLILFPWAIGFRLHYYEWTHAVGNPIAFTVIQANIPQDVKWDKQHLAKISDIYYRITKEHQDRDLIVWPEAAVPYVYTQQSDHYDSLDFLLRRTNTTLVFGSLHAAADSAIYNSILVAGAGAPRIQPVYAKKTLVPFGEYVPMQKFVNAWLPSLSLTNFNLAAGQDPRAFSVGDWRIAPSICYEITQGDYIARLARDAHFLITLSNDSWFGDSLGPHQHMHLARMRAVENQRYLIRSTNNGITALVAPNGKILSRLAQFQQGTLTKTLSLHQGRTPYQLSGDLPIIFISLIFSLVSFLFYRRALKKI